MHNDKTYISRYLLIFFIIGVIKLMRIIKALLKNFKLSFHHENEGTYTIVLPLDIILCASKHHYLQYLKKNVRYLTKYLT